MSDKGDDSADDGHTIKASAYVEQARKKVRASKTFRERVFGGKSLNTGLDYFSRAGNLLILAGRWGRAGEVYSEAAQVHLTTSRDLHEAGKSHVLAAKCYRKQENPEKSVESLTKAVLIFTDLGCTDWAAKHHHTIAETYENDMNNMKKALEHYETAAELIKNSPDSETPELEYVCLIKAASLAAQLEQYERAIDIYNQLVPLFHAAEQSDSVCEFLFRCLLCHLCRDETRAARALGQYCKDYEAEFLNTAEAALVKKLILYAESRSADRFYRCVDRYERDGLTLDEWHRLLLARIKTRITGKEKLKRLQRQEAQSITSASE